MNDLVSLFGYRADSPFAGNPYLDIHTPEGLIDMSNTPIDLIGIDNKGNKKKMKAGRKNPYRFQGNVVREIPYQIGGIIDYRNDPLRPQGLGVPIQDGTRPLPLFDKKAIGDMSTLEYKFTNSVARAKQQTAKEEYTKKQLEKRKAAIDKSNTDGGFKNSAIAEKMRLFPNDATGWGEVVDDYLNPARWIGHMADDIGHAKNAKDLLKASVMPIVAGLTGFSPLDNAITIAKNPITKSIIQAPKRIIDAASGKNFSLFDELQRTAPSIDESAYNTLRGVNKAGNIYHNGTIPIDERFKKLVALDIPEENIVKLTGKTRQELLQEAAEFTEKKKMFQGYGTTDPIQGTGTIDLRRPVSREIRNRLGADFDINNINLNQLNLDDAELFNTHYINRMSDMEKANFINNKVNNITENLYSKQFSKKYIPVIKGDEEVKDLLSAVSRAVSNDAEQVIKNKASEFSKSPKGTYSRAAQSLSDGSFPAYITNAQREVLKGSAEPVFGGFNSLNSMGFLKSSGIDKNTISGYLNKSIDAFNKATGRNIPKSYVMEDNVYYPDIILKKLRYGGINNPYQKGGNAYDFLFGDDDNNDDNDNITSPEELTAPVAEDITPPAMDDYDMSLQMAMSMGNDPFAGRREMDSLPHGVQDAEIQSSGKYGSEHVGEYGRQIYSKLSSDLGYNPVANSIYRDAGQQAELVKQGIGAKNSWHLTGNAIDLKPQDWNKLSRSQQSFYRNNYDVVYHNNHYHIEPRR